MANGSILHIVASTDRRGAETFAVNLSARLAALGWRSETLALAPGRSGGLDLESLGDAPLSSRTLHRLRRRTRSSNVAVAHGSTTLPACALALSGSGRPFVYRNVGDPYHWATSRLRRLRTAAFMARAARIVALTDRAATAMGELYRVGSRKVTVIPNGVSGTAFRPASAGARQAARTRLGVRPTTRLVLAVGALSPEKGMDVAVAAIARMDAVDLVVAGDGPELDSLRRQASRLDVDGRVLLLGSVPDPADLYAAADAFVLPSRTEGLPATAIEAALCGLPIVATDVGYVADVVADQVTGILVPPDDADALARGLDRGLASDAGLGAAARAHALRHFEMDVVTARWDELLRSLVAR